MRTSLVYTTKNKWFPYLMIAPAFIWVYTFVFYPIFYAAGLSFTNRNLLVPDWQFVGFETYINVFLDPVTLQTLKNTVFWVGGGTLLSVLVGLGIGTFLSRGNLVTKFLTAIILIPWILPEIIVSALWKWMFNGDWGIINQVIFNTHIIKDYVYWFANPKTVLIVLTFITSWRVIPFSALIISAGIKTIPNELYEAAEIDGASSWKKYKSITLPLIQYPIVMGALLTSMWILNSFTVIYTITHGGPVHYSEVITTLIYKMSFLDYDFGSGSALSIAGFIIIFIICYIYLRIFKKTWF